MDDHTEELLQLIRGSPQPDLTIGGMAEAIGIPEDDAQRLLDALVADGRVWIAEGRPVVAEETDVE
jgi:DNA-binding IclR family transcriptional regulator